MSFLDVKISRKNSKFVITVYCKLAFSGIYIHFESFLPSTHKFGMLYTLVYRCFTLCSDWTRVHRDLKTSKEIFWKNDYSASFIGKYFKKFLDRLHIIKSTLATVEKMPLHLVLPYCCKLQVMFKSVRKLFNIFKLKIVYLTIYCQAWFMNTCAVDALLLIIVRQRDT